MVSFFLSLLGWLPPLLRIIAIGAFAIFVFVTLLRVIALILDIIPFL